MFTVIRGQIYQFQLVAEVMEKRNGTEQEEEENDAVTKMAPTLINFKKHATAIHISC